MYYYDPENRRPLRWALILTALYGIVVGTAFALVRFEPTLLRPAFEGLEIEFTEPEPVPEPEPERPRAVEPRMHDRVDQHDNEQQVTGKQEETRTVNQRALFRQPVGGVDDEENAGNPKAREDEKDKAQGTGGGLSADGNVLLDSGLQGRGIVGDPPKPIHPGGRAGKVVVKVTVDNGGRVVSATYEPNGSTLSDGTFIDAAIAAARKTRFTESRAIAEGGTITYFFNLK